MRNYGLYAAAVILAATVGCGKKDTPYVHSSAGFSEPWGSEYSEEVDESGQVVSRSFGWKKGALRGQLARLETSDGEPVTVTALGAADLDGDGDPDVLIGTADGRVIALENKVNEPRQKTE